MPSYARFVIKYISDAINNGGDPVEVAKEEIQAIDEKLHEAESLKVRRMKLLKVLDRFKDDSFRKKRKVVVPSSEDVEEDERIKSIQEKVVQVLRKSDKPLTMNEITTMVASYDEDTLVIRAVKNLGDDEIVTRDDQKRLMLAKQGNK